MRVLLTEFDLFRSVGGGQTFYRGIIRRNPHIDFWYLRRDEPVDAPRPANAHPLLCQPTGDYGYLDRFAEPGPSSFARRYFPEAEDIARAATGMHFDVVDSPDYVPYGIFLRAALQKHEVAFDRLILSMHGVISTTGSMNWNALAYKDPPLVVKKTELLHYAAVDGRYFISKAYQDEWRQRCPLDSQWYDPLQFFAPPRLLAYDSTGDRPKLAFIGRTERCKGPHLFVELLGWLPRDSYAHASLIGPESHDRLLVSSSDHLRAMIERRRLDIAIQPSATPDELASLFASQTVVFLTSVYDTLNLVALEALFAGCPTVIGSGAGVCRYLTERFPTIPFIQLDLQQFHKVVPKIEDLLANYHEHREKLNNVLTLIDFSPIGSKLDVIYQQPVSFDPAARSEAAEWHRWFADSSFSTATPIKPGATLRAA